ncbi:hypothetical protein [Limnohabitans sp.]|uniref:hypothetical protein n=1 Tax=Limnohabitans sp. TaxID=1907725 RepID=UPI00286EE4E4|nr:hypothetical protein [Limnohabitans sp.]
MQKLNKCVATWLLCTFCASAAYAQSTGTTLEQAIELARASKSGELGLRPGVRASSESVPLPKPARTEVVQPKIWSITGLDRDLTAEVVYEGKVYPLSLVRNHRRVGPWMLVRLSANSADFAYLPKGQQMSKKVHMVEVFPPASHAQLQGYFEAPLLMGAPVVGSATGVLGARPPLPPELMRPAMQP